MNRPTWTCAAFLMMAGFQPPVIYEIAPLFLPVAVTGLCLLLDDNRSALVRGALVISGSTVTVLTPFITLAALGSILGLLLVGIALRRTASLPYGWKAFPMAMAISILPSIASSAVLQATNKRLFQLPTLIVELDWVIWGPSWQ